MKILKTIVLSSLIFSLFWGTKALAFEVLTPNTESGNLSLESGKIIYDNAFGAGNDVDIRGNIENDAFFAGQTVSLHQRIGKNAFVAGQTVHINGQIEGDLFLAGQDVYIDETAIIKGDVFIAGNNIHINGNITGKAKIYGNNVYLNGLISKNLIVNASILTLQSKGRIVGDLSGNISKPIIKESTSSIGGRTDLKLVKKTNNRIDQFGFEALFSLLFAFLSTLAIGTLANYLAPNFIERVRSITQKNTLNSGLIGLAACLISIPLFILLIMLMVTAPIAILEVGLIISIAVISHIFAVLWVGDTVGTLINKKYWPFLTTLTIGGLIYIIFSHIPFLGTILTLTAFCIATGAILIDLWNYYLKKATK